MRDTCFFMGSARCVRSNNATWREADHIMRTVNFRRAIGTSGTLDILSRGSATAVSGT